MLHLKNRLYQPLVLHTADGGTVHLLARQKVALADAFLSDDIRRAEKLGHITVTTIEARPPAKPPAKSTRRKGARR